MSPEDALKVITERETKYRTLLEGLIPPARAAVNVLKDHKMSATAAELEAQLFAIETHDAETKGLINADPIAFFEALRVAFQKPKH
jgi:hypothetical protein